MVSVPTTRVGVAALRPRRLAPGDLASASCARRHDNVAAAFETVGGRARPRLAHSVVAASLGGFPRPGGSPELLGAVVACCRDRGAGGADRRRRRPGLWRAGRGAPKCRPHRSVRLGGGASACPMRWPRSPRPTDRARPGSPHELVPSCASPSPPAALRSPAPASTWATSGEAPRLGVRHEQVESSSTRAQDDVMLVPSGGDWRSTRRAGRRGIRARRRSLTRRGSTTPSRWGMPSDLRERADDGRRRPEVQAPEPVSVG